MSTKHVNLNHLFIFLDEVLTCSVCDRAFITARQLLVHQNNRKHFGCSKCDLTFSCVQELRDHKDKLDHWSDLDDEEVETNHGDVNQDQNTQEKKQQIDSCNNSHVSEDGRSQNPLHGCFSSEDEFSPSLTEMERLL